MVVDLAVTAGANMLQHKGNETHRPLNDRA